MADYVVPKLPNRVIPLTQDCDRRVTIQRTDDQDNPLDWDADIYMLIDIDRTNPTRVDAEVVDDIATITIESEIADQCRSGLQWRVVRSSAGDPTYEEPLMVGVMKRNDGR